MENNDRHVTPGGSPMVEARITQLSDLPSPPFVIARVLSITGDDDQSADSLAAAIEGDHAFTLKVLRVANSAYFGMPQQIYTVRDAIVLIGFEAVRSLAIAAAAVTGIWVEDNLFDRRAFWIHSLSCGIYSEMIARRLRHPKPDAVFTLGVLHDIGRVIIIQVFPELYRQVIEHFQSQHVYLWQAEKELLGFHHGDVGARLAQKWKLPLEYSDAIQFHHEPDLCERDSNLPRILTLADALSHHTSATDNDRYHVVPLYRALWEPIGLSEATVREVRSTFGKVKERSQYFYDTATA